MTRIFLFLHVMAMLGNIMIALGRKMTIMGTLLGGFGVVHIKILLGQLDNTL